MLVRVSDFYTFLDKCKSDRIFDIDEVIIPVKSAQNGRTDLHFTVYRQQPEAEMDLYRPVDPVKILYYPTRERVSPVAYKSKKRLITGVKACDLKALQLIDRALINDEFFDPSYKHWRAHSIIIANDCTDCTATCHCILTEGKPYPEGGFDLNLSRVNGSYALTTGSETGAALLDEIKKHVPVASVAGDTRKKLEQNRLNLVRKLEKSNEKYLRDSGYRYLRAKKHEHWQLKSGECIGCGACTNICPTCYCLILNDESNGHEFVKVRSTDSCQLHGYARVAGGGSPRQHMHERFRNRYLCKFDYMQHNFDEIGCTGCGRCHEACAACIDFRQVVKELNHSEV